MRSSPAIKIDQSTNCMAGATDAVAYRNDRIVLRTGATNPSVKNTVNNKLHQMYGGGPSTTSGRSSGSRSPLPPVGHTDRPRVVGHAAAHDPSGAPHDILGLARRLRNESGKIASPDYALTVDGPYTHYFPHGYPKKIVDAHPTADQPDPEWRPRRRRAEDRNRCQDRGLRHRPVRSGPGQPADDDAADQRPTTSWSTWSTTGR